MKFNKTYLILTFGMVLWGMYPILTHKIVLGLDPLFLVSVSMLIASFPFIIQLILKKEYKRLFSQKTLKTSVPVALFTAAGMAFLFAGTKLTSGINTGLLLQVEPVYSLILGAIFLREIIGSAQIGATLIMVIGAMTIVYKKGGMDINFGDLLILLSPLMFQISHAIGKKLLNKGADVSLILAGRHLYGGIILIIFTFLTNKSIIDLFNFNNFKTASYLGLYLALLAFLWYSSIKKVPVSVASSFLPLTALVSLLGSVFFLKETISIQQYIGFFFIVGGIIWQTHLPIHKTSS